MGLHVQSLYEIPVEGTRRYFIYLLDYGWSEPLGETLMNNYEKMASIASENDAVIIRGTKPVHFEDEVLSWHNVNGQNADDLLPAILITNRNPHRFKESRKSNEHPAIENNLKLILIPLRRFCSNATEVITLIEKLMKDIKAKKELNNFRIVKEMKKGADGFICDGIVLAPNECESNSISIKDIQRFLVKDSKYSSFLLPNYKNKFINILVELYDKGPESDRIWQRAGGEVSFLIDSNSRCTQWYEAIDRLSKGGGGMFITIESLIDCVKEDYPNNKLLENLLEEIN